MSDSVEARHREGMLKVHELRRQSGMYECRCSWWGKSIVDALDHLRDVREAAKRAGGEV